jgi:hypothetical protein
MQGTSKAEQVFQPGELAPVSGVYGVVHERHRQKHSATVFKGERFPQCLRCGKAVRFILLRPSTPISEDVDFRKASEEPSSQETP